MLGSHFFHKKFFNKFQIVIFNLGFEQSNPRK